MRPTYQTVCHTTSIVLASVTNCLTPNRDNVTEYVPENSPSSSPNISSLGLLDRITTDSTFVNQISRSIQGNDTLFSEPNQRMAKLLTGMHAAKIDGTYVWRRASVPK